MTDDIAAMEARLDEAYRELSEAKGRLLLAERAFMRAAAALTKARWGVAVGDVVMAGGKRFVVGAIHRYPSDRTIKPNIAVRPEFAQNESRCLRTHQWEPLP